MGDRRRQPSALLEKRPPHNAITDRETRCLSLLNDSRSHGPYLWTNRDLHNALLWFGETGAKSHPDEESDRKVPSDEIDSNSIRDDGKRDGAVESIPRSSGTLSKLCLLRRILFSNGALECRRRTSKGHGKCRQSKLARASSGGAVGPIGTDGTRPAMDSITALNALRVGTLRREKRKEPLLRSVLGEYCKCALRSVDRQTKDESESESPSRLDRLRRDLIRISKSRGVTQDLYDCNVELSRRAASWLGIATGSPRETAMNASDLYFSNGDTVTRRAYAARIFERIRRELETLPENRGIDKASGDNCQISSDLLTKLRSLALRDEKIREVHVLMLLEPTKPHADGTDSIPTPSTEGTSSASTASRLVIRSLCAMIDDDHDPEATVRRPADGVWSLPSPLLCAVSHFHFTMARRYVRHLISSAVRVHNAVPRYVTDVILNAAAGGKFPVQREGLASEGQERKRRRVVEEGERNYVAGGTYFFVAGEEINLPGGGSTQSRATAGTKAFLLTNGGCGLFLLIPFYEIWFKIIACTTISTIKMMITRLILL